MKNRTIIGLVVLCCLIIIVAIAIVVAILIRNGTFDSTTIRSDTVESNVMSLKMIQQVFSKHLRLYDDFLYSHTNEEIINFDVNNTKINMKVFLENLSLDVHSISKDQNNFILIQNQTKLLGGRYRDLATYALYKAREQKLVFVHHQGHNKSETIRVISLAPNDRSVAFVVNGVLYYQEDPFRLEEAKVIIKPDRDEDKSVLQYGFADWLYEEEIMIESKALWWNMNSKLLLYASFDDRNVSQTHIPFYGDENKIYVDYHAYSVPMAGEIRPNNNPIVKLYVYDTQGGKSSDIPMPDFLANEEYYIHGIRWLSNDTFLAIWYPRDWSRCYVARYSLDMKTWDILHQFSSKTGPALLDTDMVPAVLLDQPTNQLFLVAPDVENSLEAFYHILQINLTSRDKKWISPGPFDVFNVLRFDSKLNILLIGANYPKPFHKNYLSLNLNENALNLTCLTCEMDQCHMTASPNAITFLQRCFNLDSMHKQIFRLDSSNFTFKSILLLTNHTHDLDSIFIEGNYKPKVVMDEMVIRKDSEKEATNVSYVMIYPPGFTPTKKYPLVLNVYGGPGLQFVTKTNIMSEVYRSMEGGFIVLRIDGRGTKARGLNYINKMYKKAGDVEVADQLDTIKELIKQGYVDETKIAVFGWSYGGFLSGHLLASNHSVRLKCGILGAPVTDFRYYDTAYSERLLGLYKNNQLAYNNTSIMRKVKNMIGKKVLLVHGSADDNVRFLNSIQLMNSMYQNDVDYQFLIYKDAAHSPSQKAFERDSLRFFSSCFKK